MEIATERLLLRDFTPGDWPAVLSWQRDPRYLRYYAWTDRIEDEVRAFVQRFVDEQAESPRRRFQLSVRLKGGDRLIGDCGIRRKPGNEHEADVGFEIAPEYWGRGYATEAARAIVAFGFEELKLHRVSSWCIAENAASARVLEKLGMTLEGRLRESERFKGRWWDTLLFGLLESDWRAGRP